MSEKDQERWDAKWESRTQAAFEVHPVLTNNQELLKGEGDALDLPCGRGQNTLWLAALGYRVVGLDISRVALDFAMSEAQRHGQSQRTEFNQVDIDHYPLPEAAYDLICVIRFLDRSLFPGLKAALRPGGLIVYATRHLGALEIYPDTNSAYLLRDSELLREFDEWPLLHYHEGPIEAEIIASKPPKK
ncbi:MAG TPA: class I SAM-dependent methyltransferase [candidate division Zixibacteria bacterium]|nr:class I SAM-dependent methyltransferase [candidate division Zixibacteria bacterium]